MKRVIEAVVLLMAVALTATVTWHFARQDLRRCEVDDTLRPIAALLEDNRTIVEAIKKDGMAESESVILSTYLAQVRKDGVSQHSAFKQRIDALVNNNTMIVALLSKYTPRARTTEFRVAADKFVDYATTFRDRWQSVFEIFMAGGNLSAMGPVPPADFVGSVAKEGA
jgi:hypothetical protein